MGHRVHKHEGKCSTLHGHRYAVEVTVSAPDLEEAGFVIDFGAIKSILGAWIDESLDHTMALSTDDPLAARMCKLHYENDMKPVYLMGPPTAENIARMLYDKASKMLAASVKVDYVTVFETPNCSARYPSQASSWRGQ